MFTRTILFVSLVLCILIKSGFSDYFKRKPTLDIFYESLDYECSEFMTNILGPNWKKLEPYINFRFIPFGHSKETPNGDLICENGPVECVSNALHSCVLHKLSGDQTAQLTFVSCVMNQETFGEWRTCIDDLDISAQDINECLHSDVSKSLQKLAKIQTEAHGTQTLPIIVLNEDVQIDANYKFISTLCEKIPSMKDFCCG